MIDQDQLVFLLTVPLLLLVLLIMMGMEERVVMCVSIKMSMEPGQN